MRIAVTGGTGFIGRHFAQRLILEGHEVVLLARGKNAASEVGGAESTTFVASDLSDQAVLTDAFSGCDAIAHCADDLSPTRRFTDDQIRKGLPAPGSFTFRDLRFCA